MCIQAVGLVQSIELDADAYVAEKVGCEKALDALEWLYNNASWATTRKEVKRRIKALKKLQRA